MLWAGGGGVDKFFLPVLEVGERCIKSGYLKIPGSWISAGLYIDIVSIIITKYSRTPQRQWEVPKCAILVVLRGEWHRWIVFLSIFYIVLTRFLCVWQLQYQWFLGTSLSQLVSGLLLPLVSASSLAHSDRRCQPVHRAAILRLPVPLCSWLDCPPPFSAFRICSASGTVTHPLFLTPFSPPWLSWYVFWFFLFSVSFSPSTFP